MSNPVSQQDTVADLDNMLLVAGNASQDLAAGICSRLRMRLARVELGTFSDGEVRAEFSDNIRGKDVFIIQSLARPVNRSMMELVLLADAARRSSAASVCAVVPYLGYSRQDRRPHGNRTPISARVVADIVQSVGISRMVTIDIHAEQIQGYYNIPFENIYASPVLMGDLSRKSKHSDSLTMIAPDIGGVARARALAAQVEARLAIIDKRRPMANVAQVMHTIGDVEGCDCVLIDDMIDTAGTLCAAAKALCDNGAARVRAYCTHMVLSGKAIEHIENSPIDEVVGTDTITLQDNALECDKIRTLSVADLLAETLLRIQVRESVGSLFI